jgi:hypothetical protein
MPDKRLAFCHARKNAGSAIKQFFADLQYPLEVHHNFPVNPHNYHLFGVARHPYDRCISGWKYCESTRSRTLLDCLTNPPDTNHVSSDPLLVEGHDWRHFTATQCHFLYDESRLTTVDHLLRYECLEDNLMALCDHFNIVVQDVRLKKINEGVFRVAVEPLTIVERSAIYNHFIEDFNLLGYDP